MKDSEVEFVHVGNADARGWASARKKLATAASSTAVAAAMIVASPANAAECQFYGTAPIGGERPLAVDATCTDPDYNENTLVIDSVVPQVYTDASGQEIPYTEVRGHFPATNTEDTLPPGVTQSPTLKEHAVLWRFPAKEFWRNRSFQQTYPVGSANTIQSDDLNDVDKGFAFTNGAMTIRVGPGNPRGGYRVNAAATKLAKAYANQFYGNSDPIYSYLWGQSGGSAQALGAAEGTTGVWAGVIPVVIATSGLIVHSFMWQALYATAVPLDKRAEVREAAEVGSGRSIYDPLDAEQRAILDELLKAGFPREGLNTALSVKLANGDQVPVGDATVGALVGPFPGVSGPSLVFGPGGTSVRVLDRTYEDDFWSKPGYAGANPPNYLAAAKVDGFATITEIVRDAQGVPTMLKFDPATVPALGSIGAAGLNYYVYAADGTTRTIDETDPNKPVFTLSGVLDTTTSTLNLAVTTDAFQVAGVAGSPSLNTTSPFNSPVLLNALTVGGKIRINNRYFLAVAHYPRHSIVNNGNPAYDQYKDAFGRPKYPQRAIQWVAGPDTTKGGIVETGAIKTKTMVMENLEDANSFPYVAGFYASQVQKTLGKKKADDMFRVYFQEHWSHSNGGLVAGIFNQMVLDLVAWAERGVTPKPSSVYTIDSMTQVVQPASATNRKGLQPVINLTASDGLTPGGDRVEVTGVLQPAYLSATIQMPPATGEIFKFNWHIERQGVTPSNEPVPIVAPIDEPATVLASPNELVTVSRPFTFQFPGDYIVSLNASGDRNGASGTATEVKNFDRVRVVVR